MDIGLLTSWSMVQSMALCGLAGLLTVWWSRNAAAGQPDSDPAHAPRETKQADAASTRSKLSLTGRCRRLHSSLHSDPSLSKPFNAN